MPPTSMKNASLSPAGTDLGLGQNLTQQVEDEPDDARKKRLALPQGSLFSPASMSLLGQGMLTNG